MPNLQVRHVCGRYPFKARVLRSENIEAKIESEYGALYRIRLDDTTPGHESMWLELIIELEEPE